MVPTRREARAQLADIEYEIKFAAPLERSRAFLTAVRDRLRVTIYDPVLPVAFTRTVYLDTPDWRYLTTSAAELQQRLRIRQYAGAPDDGVPPRFTGLCFLEYKESAAGRRRKARLRISPRDIEAILRDPGARLAALRHGGDDAAIDVLVGEMAGAMLIPQLMTWYRRQSMADESGRVRVTLDTQIAFCPPLAPAVLSDLGSFGCGPVGAVGQAPESLLEIKHDGEPPDWLAPALRHLGVLPATRLSKYVMGMQILDRARHPGAALRACAPGARQ